MFARPRTDDEHLHKLKVPCCLRLWCVLRYTGGKSVIIQRLLAEVVYHMAKKTHAARSARPTTAARRTQPAAIARPKAGTDESSTNGNGNGAGDKIVEKSATAIIAAPTPRRTAPPISTRPAATTKSKTPTTPTS